MDRERGRVRLLGRVVKKRVRLGSFLLRIEGIGPWGVVKICKRLNIRSGLAMGVLRGAQVEGVEKAVGHVMGTSLYGKYWVKWMASHLVSRRKRGLIRGQRVVKGLPARGQRRKSNGKSCRRSKIRRKI